MKNLRIALTSLLLAGTALAADPTSYSLDLDVSPTGSSGAYVCKATIAELDSGKVLSAPAIGLIADSPATATTTDGDLVSELTVSVNSKESRATAQLKVSKAGKLVALQKTSVAVR